MSTETQRAEFQAAFDKLGYQWSESNQDKAFLGWKLAQASQAAELAALKADIAEYVHIASEQATEIEALETAAIRVIASLYLAHEDCGAGLGGKVAAQRMLDAAMQTKEAS